METEKDFQIGQIVCLTSDPTKQGAVVGISGRVYSVFIGNEIHTFYREQIQATRQNEDKERESAEYPMAKIRAALSQLSKFITPALILCIRSMLPASILFLISSGQP